MSPPEVLVHFLPVTFLAMSVRTRGGEDGKELLRLARSRAGRRAELGGDPFRGLAVDVLDDLPAVLDVDSAKVDGRRGVTFVDNFRDPETRRAPYWSPDRLHLNSLGHQRVASRVLTALGVPTPVPVVPAADATRTGPVVRVLGEVRYWVVYVLPWLGRRLLGRSSGDGREPKYPTWVRMPPNGEMTGPSPPARP